ncbi:unnamed protein product [Calypogeia fissa]
MALLSTNFRTVASQLQSHSLPRLPNSTSSSGRSSGRSVISSSQHSVLLLTPPDQCCRFIPRPVPAVPLGLIRNFGHHPAQLKGTLFTTETTTPVATICSAGGLMSMADPTANCTSGMEPLAGQVSAPIARFVGGFIASLMTLAGGLLGSAGNWGGGEIIQGGGGGVEGEEKVGGVTDLLRLGCGGALVTPVSVGTAASSSSGVWWPQYLPGLHDIFAGVATLAGALAFLQIFNELAKRDVLEKKLSRKLVHIGVGLGFMLFWPLFTPSAIAPYLAAFAPAMNGVRMLLIGYGLMDNDAIVKSMTRDGDRRELLRGPFYYALAVVVTTVGFWRTSPVGIVAIVNLCAGDGFADIIGRNFGTSKLPYNEYKSIAGTVGFFIMASLISMIYLSYFAAFGLLQILPGTFLGVILVSFFTALVESLPISTRLDDNFTVPFAAIVLGLLFLPVPK